MHFIWPWINVHEVSKWGISRLEAICNLKTCEAISHCKASLRLGQIAKHFKNWVIWNHKGCRHFNVLWEIEEKSIFKLIQLENLWNKAEKENWIVTFIVYLRRNHFARQLKHKGKTDQLDQLKRDYIKDWSREIAI